MKLCSIMLATAWCAASPAAIAQTDAASFGALPSVSEAQISPDGTTVAMLQSIGETTAILFYDLTTPGSQPIGVGVGESKARDIKWADNEHLLLLASQASRVDTTSGLQTIEFWRWVSISKSRQKADVLFGNEAGYFMSSPGALLTTLPADPDKALFSRITTRTATRGGGPSRLNDRDGDIAYALFKVDLDSGAAVRIETGDSETDQWIVNVDGNVTGRVDFDSASKTLELFTVAGGAALKKVASYPFSPEGKTVGFVGQIGGGGLVATSYLTGDTRVAIEIDPATGATSRTLYSHPTFDVDDVIYDASKAAATGVLYIDDLPRAQHFDPADQKMQESLSKALKGAAPMIVSKSEDGNKALVRAIYTDHPDQYFLFDRRAKALNLIAPTYPSLDGKVIAKKEKYDYESADGLAIPGYLTVGAGASKSSMPLIVLPHGGPAGRDDMSFDWWSFFYAANGFLVYQPNFRGSDGYGYDFKAAGYGEWGRKMQDDITDGVKRLIADGIVDPNRICIIGASYGGYAALAGATLTPDLYACSVSVNGVSNLPSMIGRSAGSSELAEDYWDVRLGSRFRDAKALNEVSPAKIADRAGAPILLIHGKDDTVVPIGQSIEMRNALQKAGKQVEFVELKGEDHWLSRASSRTAMLERSLAFVNKHIGVKQSAGSPSP